MGQFYKTLTSASTPAVKASVKVADSAKPKKVRKPHNSIKDSVERKRIKDLASKKRLADSAALQRNTKRHARVKDSAKGTEAIKEFVKRAMAHEVSDSKKLSPAAKLKAIRDSKKRSVKDSKRTKVADMARAISEDAMLHFIAGKPKKLGNTEIHVSEDTGDVLLRLHGNLIAKRHKDNDATFEITTAGYNTLTTKERLNALPGVHVTTKKGELFLNEKPWDGEWTEIGGASIKDSAKVEDSKKARTARIQRAIRDSKKRSVKYSKRIVKDSTDLTLADVHEMVKSDFNTYFSEVLKLPLEDKLAILNTGGYTVEDRVLYLNGEEVDMSALAVDAYDDETLSKAYFSEIATLPLNASGNRDEVADSKKARTARIKRAIRDSKRRTAREQRRAAIQDGIAKAKATKVADSKEARRAKIADSIAKAKRTALLGEVRKVLDSVRNVSTTFGRSVRKSVNMPIGDSATSHLSADADKKEIHIILTMEGSEPIISTHGWDVAEEEILDALLSGATK